MTRIRDVRHDTSISKVTPGHFMGDVSVGGLVTGIAGFDLPAGTPGDGQVPVFNSGTGLWEWGDPGINTVEENGVSVVSPAKTLDAGHGLDVTNEGSGVAGLAVDETELDGTLIPGTSLIVKDEGTPLATAASSMNFVGGGVTASGATAAKTITIPTVAAVFGWFIPEDYGAAGDNSAADLAACNLAIAALNARGRGILYLPNRYKISTGLDPITVSATVMGNGGADGSTNDISLLNCTSATASALTLTAHGCTVRGIKIVNTAGSTPSAGFGINCPGGILARFEDLTIAEFYSGIDIENAQLISMDHVYIANFRKYGLRLRNTAVPDADIGVAHDVTISSPYVADACVRHESGGGFKLSDYKFNSGGGPGSRPVTGYDLAVGTGVSTSQLFLIDGSIENLDGDAIRLVATGAGAFRDIYVRGLQTSLPNNTGFAVKASGAGISRIFVDDLDATTTGTARAVLSLTNCDIVVIYPITYSGFNANYTSSGATNIVDNTGSIAASVRITGTPAVGDIPIATGGTAAAWGPNTGAGGLTGFATPAILLGTAAAAGAATTAIRSDSTIVAFDATAPTTSAVGDAAAAGSVAFAARRNHTHGRESFGSPVAVGAVGAANADGAATTPARSNHVHALTYHDEPLTDGASNFIFAGGDVVVVTGVPN